MATGAVMNIGGDPGAMICSFEELKALSDAAKEQGTYVAAHCHGKKGIMACAEAEIGSIEHASYIDDACIETLLAHGNQTFIVPTVEIAYSMLKDLTGNTPAFMHERSIEIMEHISEYMTKARSWVSVSKSISARKNATMAPPANQTVVRAMVATSIPTRTAKAISQYTGIILSPPNLNAHNHSDIS